MRGTPTHGVVKMPERNCAALWWPIHPLHCLGPTQAFPGVRGGFEAEAFCFTHTPPTARGLAEAARRPRDEAKEAKAEAEAAKAEAAMTALLVEDDKGQAGAQHASKSKKVGKKKKKKKGEAAC